MQEPMPKKDALKKRPRTRRLGLCVTRLLKKTAWPKDDIGAYEINDAIAAQALACNREPRIDNENAPLKR
jgi:hypothetical protein